MNFSAPFIRRPVMTTLLMVSILFFGIYAFRVLPISDMPNVNYPTITVTASQPGGSPEYMGNLVATPLEREFAQISGLSAMTSNNTTGTTQIVLNFDLSADISSKEVEVQAAISEAIPNLPVMPTYPIFQKTNPSDTPIIFLALTSNVATQARLYELAYDILAQPLSMISGISQVQVYGLPYAVRVQADPMKMMGKNIDMNDLVESLITSNPNLASGNIQGKFMNYLLQTDGMISEGEKYNDVIIKEIDNTPLYVGNVANGISALEQRDPYFKYFTKDSQKNTVVLAVSRLPDSNTLDISKEIQKQLPQLEKTLPGSVSLEFFYDKSASILSSIKDVEITLTLALILVVGVIFLALGKWIDALIPSLVLPMSLIATFIVMYFMGFNIDNLSLLALILAIGFVVDDAIVVLENIYRHTEMGKSSLQAALDGSKQISITVVTMSLALSAVFIPFIWMPGLLGRVFHEFSVTIVAAIYCSGFISLTLNPMLCSRFLEKQKMKKKLPRSEVVHQKLVQIYEKCLLFTFRFKKTVIIFGVICIFLSLFLLKWLPKDFIPIGNLSIIKGLAQCIDSSSKANTIAHQAEIGEKLQKSPFMEKFLSIGGYPEDSQGIFFIHLVDAKKRPTSVTVARKLMKQLPVTGMNIFLKPFPVINLQVGNTSSLGEYQYVLSSLDTEALHKGAKIITQEMEEIPLFSGVNSDMHVNTPQLNIEIDRDRAGTYGVTAEQIEQIFQYSFSGGRISTFSKGSNVYDLIPEVAPEFDLTVGDIDLLYIKADTSLISSEDTSTPSLIPMTALASWNEVLAPGQVNHVNTFPSVTISFNLGKGATLGEALAAIDSLGTKYLPDHVTGSLQGATQVFTKTFSVMGWLSILAVIVIYLLLGILYESFIHPITILSALPIAVLGGLITLKIAGMSLSLYSVVGLIVLIGLVQKNGVMLIDFALEILDKPGQTPLSAILESCRERFRPILMTTVAAMVGVLPIAIGIGENAAINRPLGLVVFGGLLFSQLITLFVTPIVFLYMQRLEELLTRKTPKHPLLLSSPQDLDNFN